MKVVTKSYGKKPNKQMIKALNIEIENEKDIEGNTHLEQIGRRRRGEGNWWSGELVQAVGWCRRRREKEERESLPVSERG